MPVLKIILKSYSDDTALKNVVDYVLRPGCDYSGYAVDPDYAVEQMQCVKDVWGKDRGRRVRHFLLSFGPGERIGSQRAMEIGFEICKHYAQYQTVFCLHDDSKHLHLHFAVNTVSFIDGKKYAATDKDWHELRGYIAGLLPDMYVLLEYTNGKTEEQNKCFDDEEEYMASF